MKLPNMTGAREFLAECACRGLTLTPDRDNWEVAITGARGWRDQRFVDRHASLKAEVIAILTGSPEMYCGAA